MEMIKRKFIVTFSIKMSDRFFGFITGLVKGVIVVLALILVLEISKAYVASFTSQTGYENYVTWLDNSKAYHYGCDALDKIEHKSPWFSNTVSRLNISFTEKEKPEVDEYVE